MYPVFSLAGWLLGLTACAVAGGVIIRYRQLARTSRAIVTESAQLLEQVTEMSRDVYRVKLSCPVCEWTDVVVRENRPIAIEEGNRRIVEHNSVEGHLLSGAPRAGYFRGEPLN
jgi:hypothetical protein